MGKHIVSLIFTISVCCLTGCANTGIVKISPDTYMLSRVDHGGIFGNAARMKANVIREATEFAEKQGKVAIPLATKESPMWPGHFASIEYQFRVVDKNDPEARRTHLEKTADITIKSDDSLKADINVHTKDESKKTTDLYAELIKLEDLQKRGILTKEEFKSQKKRLLENQK